MNYYQSSKEEIINQLSSNPKIGLSSQEAAYRLAKYGKNEIKEKAKKSIFAMFSEQFNDFLVMILLVAAAISIITGILKNEGLIDGFIILFIILLNAILGVYQERKASNALLALKKMTSPHARVLRDGKIIDVVSTSLVVGDIVYLESGDYVPADMRLLDSVNLKVDEAALTGESVPVEKDDSHHFTKEKILAERSNMVFMSTLITYGRASGIVTEIGMDTEIGKIATLIDAVSEQKTPLQKTIDSFAKMLGIICIGVSIFVFVLGLIQQKEIFSLFMTAIALAVAAIPEGLTAVITVVLALGMQRMVKRNAIIKDLSTVEKLGQATVICSDKTGTLTQNKLAVKKVYDLKHEYQIMGNGYSLKGDILLDNKKAPYSPALDTLLKVAILCNDARLESDNKLFGDPTEKALLVLGAKGGYNINDLRNKAYRVNEYPFESNRKCMSTINKINDKYFILTKGAPDALLKKSKYVIVNNELVPLDNKFMALINSKIESYTSMAYRVLGFAFNEVKDINSLDLEQDLIFLGLTAMIDPPRDEVKGAIELCEKANIRVMMITGDHLSTAKAIGHELGILKPNHLALSSVDTAAMSERQYEEAILKTDVFARSTPKDKIKIVEVLQKHGNVVVMTGDGVNDAPALKQADIGVSMGITGTEVTKETSNMILTDDNFASIVAAIEEGRVIYSNIRKFTIFLVSCNIGEILIILFSMLFPFLFHEQIPLLAIHLLWINLMTDSFPAFALGMEEKEKNIMTEKPRDASKPLIGRATLFKIMIQGLGLAFAALLSFYLALNVMHLNITQARTMVLATVIFGELLRTYSAKSETNFITSMKVFNNKYINYAALISFTLLLLLIYYPPFARLFNCEAIPLTGLLITLLLGFVPLLSGELTKITENS